MNSYYAQYAPTFTVDGSEIAERIEQFTNDWQESPMDLLPLVKELYLDGVKSGLRKAGHHVKDYRVLDKDSKNE